MGALGSGQTGRHSQPTGQIGGDAVDAVLDQVRAVADQQARDENFPVALRMLPREPRDLLSRVYTFARFVDDLGDEAPGDRLALLDAVAADLDALPAGGARLPAVTGLAPVLARDVPLELFADLVEANRIDQRVTRYADFDALLGYCRYSANPVGRIVLHIAGAATEANVTDSDAVCSGLQVLEHCQDVGEDAGADRVYLPATELAAAGVAVAELVTETTSPALRAVVARQVERSEQLLAAGRPLVRRLSGWARVAVAGYVAGGLATAGALRQGHYDVLGRDLRPSKAATAAYALRVVAGW